MTSQETKNKLGGLIAPVCWYMFWFTLILLVYWPGLIVFPKRDHYVYMLGRVMYDSDFEWYLKTLNYARTRLLMPGDSFAFRPVHFLVVGLEDFFFRYNLLWQGIASSALFSATATLLFHLVKKLSGSIFLGMGITLFWAFQLAGAEMLLWQHITPYILFPGFLSAALLLVIDESADKKSLVAAATMVCLSGLTHEIGGPIGLAIAAAMYLDGSEGRERFVWPFAMGGAAALAISAFDYFLIHRPASLTGTADVITSASFASMLSSLFSFTGAIGVSAFVPSEVRVFHLDNWFIAWNFLEVSKPALWVGLIAVVVILVLTITQTIRTLRRLNHAALNAVSIFALLLFFLSYVVSVIRMITRDAQYMMGAPYYFCLMSFALAIMIAVALIRLDRCSVTGTVSVVLCLLAGWHAFALTTELHASQAEKKKSYDMLNGTRSFMKLDRSYCYGGLAGPALPVAVRMWNPLYQDLACRDGDKATPVYLSAFEGRPALSIMEQAQDTVVHRELRFQSIQIPGSVVASKMQEMVEAQIPFGHPFEVTLDKINSPVFTLLTRSGHIFGLSVGYNMVSEVMDNRGTLVNNLLWYPGKATTTYRVSFTRDGDMVLIANGRYIGQVSSGGLADGEPCKLGIFSTTDGTVKVLNTWISTAAKRQDTKFTPVQLF
jgi:hypothetical protein